MVCVTARAQLCRSSVVAPLEIISPRPSSHDEWVFSTFGHFRLRLVTCSGFHFAKVGVTVARETITVKMFIRHFHTITRRFVKASISGATCFRDLGNFIKRPFSVSLPFIYGNPLSNAAGDLKLRPISRASPNQIRAWKSLCLLTWRVSTRPIWLTLRKLEKTRLRPTEDWGGWERQDIAGFARPECFLPEHLSFFRRHDGAT